MSYASKLYNYTGFIYAYMDHRFTYSFYHKLCIPPTVLVVNTSFLLCMWK